MKTYRFETKCSNCHWLGPLVIVQGKPLKNLPCPSCGCIGFLKGLKRLKDK